VEAHFHDTEDETRVALLAAAIDIRAYVWFFSLTRLVFGF